MNTGNYKGLCFYSVTICGVTTHMYYKCQSNPDSYMCTHLNVDIKGPVCAEEYETLNTC